MLWKLNKFKINEETKANNTEETDYYWENLYKILHIAWESETYKKNI